MASIIDAAEESITDKLCAIKYIIYTIPVFASYMLYDLKLELPFLVLSIMTLLMLLTIFKITLNNVRNTKEYVLPRWNPFVFIFEMIKLILVMLPFCAIFGGIGYFLTLVQIPPVIDNIQNIYTTIIWLIIGSIILTGFVFYSKSESLLETYNFHKISNYCADFLITSIFAIPKIILLNLSTLGIITYIFHFFFGLDNYVYAFICSLAISINTVILAHYYAQADYESVKHNC